jgi:hypothetical protein
MIASAVLIVLLMMGAESTRNIYSNLAVNNKYDCLKLHHVGYLMKYAHSYCSVLSQSYYTMLLKPVTVHGAQCHMQNQWD